MTADNPLASKSFPLVRWVTVSTALIGVFVAAYSLWLTVYIVESHAGLLKLSGTMRNHATSFYRKLSDTQQNGYDAARLSSLIEGDLRLVHAALEGVSAADDLKLVIRDERLRDDLKMLHVLLEKWRVRLKRAAHLGVNYVPAPADMPLADDFLALVEVMSDDIQAIITRDGRILVWTNFVSIGALLILYITATMVGRRHEYAVVTRAQQLEELVEQRTSRLNATLDQNRRQMEALAAANARVSTINSVFRDLTRMARLLSDSRDYHEFYRRAIGDAMTVTGARYGAFAVMDGHGNLLDFIAQGMSEEQRQAIGRLPGGRGLLAAIGRKQRLMRVDEIAGDPRACGFPPGHPPMHCLIGVPILVNGETRGVLYLADKQSAPAFNDEDEVVLNMYSQELSHLLDRQGLIEQLERTRADLQSIVDNNPCVIYRRATRGAFAMRFASEHITHLFGYHPADVLKKENFWYDHVHPDDLAAVREGLRAGVQAGEMALEYRFRHRDGSYRWVRDSARLLRSGEGDGAELIGAVADITERKRAEDELTIRHEQLKESNRRLEEAHDQLLQSEKMAAIGQLAAGVAHEINNPVGYISSNISTLKFYLGDLLQLIDVYGAAEPLLSEHAQALESIRSAKEKMNLDYVAKDALDLLRESQEGLARVNRIVQDLKSFAQIDSLEWEWTDLHKGIESTLNIIHNELKHKANVIKEYGPIPLIECRPSQLNQAFMNLLVNAAQAIDECGTIWIRSRVEGEWICIEIQDDGRGIAPEHLSHIFEPFFTTKPVGKGRGLGLSLAYGIVKNHGGRIDVESTVGMGTLFRVSLPRQRKIEAAD